MAQNLAALGLFLFTFFLVLRLRAFVSRALLSIIIEYYKVFKGAGASVPLALSGCLWAVAWGISGSPVFGLLSLAALPGILAAWGRWRRLRRREELDASAISFLHALLGLVRAGLSLPSALFQLCETLPTPFGLALQRFLLRYDRGSTLRECLARFRESELRASAAPLALLEMTYRNGLPVAPLLEKILPVLESERLARAKISALAKTSLGQAAVAFALPWLLAAVLSWFQPQLLVDFSSSDYAFALLAFALFWEGLGVFLVWWISRFY